MSSEYADAGTTGDRTHKLELDGVTKRYGDLVAVDDMDLVLNEGEFVCVLGPSGSGKTTTLNMIAGLERPTEGDVRIDGQRVNEDRPQDRDIGLVFQNLALFTSMTVAENIGFSKRVGGASESEIEATVDEFADIVGLEGMQNRDVSSLSMSDQQRVALARALAAKPSLLLLDEPMDNLDAEEAIDMRGELKRLQSDLNQTMIYVTHDQEEAMSLADRIVVMHQGELMQVGTPRELYERPKNRFVAGFIGSPSMNFVDLDIDTGVDVSLFGTSIDSAVLFDRLAGTDAIGDVGSIDTLTLAVRPESFEIDPEDADVAFRASLRDFEPHGSRTVLFVEADGTEMTLITEKRIDVEQGDSIPIGFDFEAAYLVDPDSDEVLYA